MEVGNKVRLIQQKLEGIITKKISSNLYEIQLEDGFNIQANSNELVATERLDTNFQAQHMKKKKILVKKEKSTSHKPIKQKNSGNHASEIDLHIQKILPNSQDLDNSQIIQVQLQTCISFVQRSIRQHKKEIVIIHGIGKGILRNEIHKILKETVSIQEYYLINQGGATKVILE